MLLLVFLAAQPSSAQQAAIVYVYDDLAGRQQTTASEIIPGVRVGPIAADTNERHLIKQYGKARVKREAIPDDDEGGSKLGTLLFPGSSDELNILWRNRTFERPKRVVLLRPGSRWKTQENITVGTSLKELEALNGGEFEFAAFAWDGAGWITSWLAGQLAARYPTNLIRFRLHVHGLDRLPWHEQELFTGSQRRLKSSGPTLGKVQLNIGEIHVKFR